MNRPVLYAIPAFDARSGTTIKFAFTGSTILKSEAIFYNSDSGSPVYGEGVFCEGSLPYYTVPANVLKNSNIAYYVKIRVYDENGNISSYSEPRLFYCIATPMFRFDLLNADRKNLITNSSTIFKIEYDNGVQDEELNYYSIYLYDKDKNQISVSAKMYKPMVEYEVFGLNSKQTYYVRSIGETKNGMVIDTSFVELYVEYTSTESYAMITLTNRPSSADIVVQSNVKSIDGTYYTGTPEYIDSKSGKAVVLLDKDKYIIFDDGVSFKNVFDIEIAMQNPRCHEVFFVLYHDKSEISFTLCKRPLKGIQNALYIIMTGTEDGRRCRYTIQSNIIDYNNEYLRVSIKRENSVWAIKLQKVDDTMEVSE